MNEVTEITLIKPDDWHLHLRDGPHTSTIVNHTARQFQRAIVMPNLAPPITTVASAEAYHDRIKYLLSSNLDFQPLMTLYLTDNTSLNDIKEAALSPLVRAVKLYPAGATTNSDAGVTSLSKIEHVLGAMEEHQVPLLVHGEVTGSDTDVFDREALFLDDVLTPIVNKFPSLRVSLEHITTQEGVDFVKSANENVAGTITPHHLLLNRNALFQGGINPHHYCLPILKREKHRRALVDAACSGDGKFFLGTDSAPHMRSKKENACGCAGIYSAHAALELYAEVFEAENALENFEKFASINGTKFYNLPINRGSITLEKKEWTVPDAYDFGGERVIPFRAGGTMSWKVKRT